MKAEKLLKQLADSLDIYIKNKHTTEECTGFINGFEKAVEILKHSQQETGELPVKDKVREAAENVVAWERSTNNLMKLIGLLDELEKSLKATN